MSKRRHKSRNDNKREVSNDNRNNMNNNNMNNRSQYNNPFGINPNQLLSMFGNIDMNQINSMLQSMNTQGFDFNNLNLGNLQNFMGGMGQGNQRGNEKTENKAENKSDTKNTNMSNANNEKKIDREDENIQMLRAVRSIVSGERADFIDKIINLYNDGVFDD